jgi:hypothetical protein
MTLKQRGTMKADNQKHIIIAMTTFLLTTVSVLSNAKAATAPYAVSQKTPSSSNSRFNDTDIGSIVKKNINNSVKKELKGLRHGEATTRKAMELPKGY